ncbi:MAG: GFA family protein [Caulobacterales bacterium]|jgi:hypothetical protein
MIRGSCLCGSLAYEADAVLDMRHCHCRTCRKAHAAAFATTAGVERNAFRWIRGDAERGCFESSPGKLRYFCTRCGSHLMAEHVGDPEVRLRIGSVDGGLSVLPEAHIWVSQAVAWDLGVDDLPRYAEGMPAR